MLKTISTIFWKDVRIEWRTKDALSAAFVFSVLVLVIFNFTLDLNTPQGRLLSSGLFWVAFAFGSTLALNRSFAIEKQDGCVRALMLAPADRSGIFVGKLLANILFMFITQLLLLPLFSMFFNVPVLPNLGTLLLVFALGAIGFSAVGTVFSAVAANTRMREIMLPILLLPVSIPVLVAAVEATSYALGHADEVGFWFKLLVVYDIVFVTLGFLVFEYALED